MDSEQPSDPWLERSLSEEAGDQGDRPDGFSDNFSSSHDDDSFQRLPDSKEYLNILERKLAKVQGKNDKKNVGGSGAGGGSLVRHLNAIKDDVMNRFLNEQQLDVQRSDNGIGPLEMSEELADGHLDTGSVLSNVERRLFPHRVALTAEELERLIEADLLSRLSSQNNQQTTQDTNGANPDEPTQ